MVKGVGGGREGGIESFVKINKKINYVLYFELCEIQCRCTQKTRGRGRHGFQRNEKLKKKRFFGRQRKRTEYVAAALRARRNEDWCASKTTGCERANWLDSGVVDDELVPSRSAVTADDGRDRTPAVRHERPCVYTAPPPSSNRGIYVALCVVRVSSVVRRKRITMVRGPAVWKIRNGCFSEDLNFSTYAMRYGGCSYTAAIVCFRNRYEFRCCAKLPLDLLDAFETHNYCTQYPII